jgi:hypothetical protein
MSSLLLGSEMNIAGGRVEGDGEDALMKDQRRAADETLHGICDVKPMTG